MPSKLPFALLWLFAAQAVGCATCDLALGHPYHAQCTAKKGPKTLFDWAVGAKEEDEEDQQDQDKKDDKQAVKEDKNGGQEKSDEAKNGKDKKKKGDEPEEVKHLDTDRPHFPEASNTVGVGRVIVESGYTFYSGGAQRQLHSFPEALVRVGMFAEWFELRFTQNVTSTITRSNDALGNQFNDVTTGLNDTVLGVKLALTEQKQCWPESAIIFQTTVPTGTNGFSANRLLPGVNYDFSWEVVKDLFGLEGVVEANGAVDDSGHTYVNAAASLAALYALTKNLEWFSEYYGLYPAGAISSSAGPQHYLGMGIVWFLSNDCMVDFRIEAGLNDHSSDYLIGAGGAVRF